MVTQDFRQIRHWLPTESATGAKFEIRKILPGRDDTFLKTLHVMDGAEIDACALRFQILQWGVEGIVAAIDYGNVNPIYRPTGSLNKCVGELDRLA